MKIYTRYLSLLGFTVLTVQKPLDVSQQGGICKCVRAVLALQNREQRFQHVQVNAQCETRGSEPHGPSGSIEVWFLAGD